MSQKVEFAEYLAAGEASQMRGTVAVRFVAASVLVISSAVNLYPLCLGRAVRNAANRGEGIPHAHAQTRCFGPYSKVKG